MTLVFDAMKDFQLLIYNTPADEILWATQKAMSSLFGVQVPDISKHIKDIFDTGELKESATVSKMETVVQRGFRGQIQDFVTLYSLDMIIAVGYRVSSARATALRIWATGILKEYIKKGFVLDDRRMKYGGAIFGKDYFRELLERVRSIRASERRIWQQITDIYAECSIDYDCAAPTTKDFYAMIQNKFHYAISGMTAAEIVYERADRNKEHMGLTTTPTSNSSRAKSSWPTSKSTTRNTFRRYDHAPIPHNPHPEDGKNLRPRQERPHHPCRVSRVKALAGGL